MMCVYFLSNKSFISLEYETKFSGDKLYEFSKM